jgi:hypothetical protein
MNINTLSVSSIAGSVWSNPTRTLTADPATDAGSATLAWTHATRTLTADPATDAGAATLVWTHSPRTLSANPVTNTAFGSKSTLSANTLLDLRPSASQFRRGTVGYVSGATGFTMGGYDGSTFSVTGNLNTTLQCFSCGSAYGAAIRTPLGNSCDYALMGFDSN